MSIEPGDFNDHAPPSVPDPVASAAAAAARDRLRLSGAIDDFFLDDNVRLHDRSRILLGRVLVGIVSAVETDLRRGAARLLADRGAPALAELVLVRGDPVLARLTRSGLLRDGDLMGELIARVDQDLIADALPAGPNDARPSLLVRLVECPDAVVAVAAKALIVAENRRRDANERGMRGGSELSAELHHRLVWWIAAALREQFDTAGDLDRAISEAALRNIAAHDEGDRIEAAAERLARIIDPQPDEWAALLVEAIDDRRFAFFLALTGHAAGIDYHRARRIALDPDGDRLWLALRAIGLDRQAIARIGLALSDADPRRDIEAFANRLDDIAAVDPATARAVLAPLRLHRDFHDALGALATR